jgi:hypothetical protein
MDRKTARELAEGVERDLKELADAYGLTVEVQGGKYGADTYTPKVVFKEAGADQSQWALFAPMLGLPADALGREFTIKHGPYSRSYKITGVRPKATKRPVMAEGTTDDKSYVFPADVVAGALERGA